MKVLMDTSTIVAGVLPTHPQNAAAKAWLMKANARTFDFYISLHTIAELYSVLTRLPVKPPISPTQAHGLIHANILSCAQTVAIDETNYIDLVNHLSQAGFRGGIIYDAIIARAAELAQVDLLVTLNVSHFQRVWPGGASRVVSATTPPP
jgi:predicted nucleic acid-binding protein